MISSRNIDNVAMSLYDIILLYVALILFMPLARTDKQTDGKSKSTTTV